MNRSDIVEELATRFRQLTANDAELAVKTILDAMNESLVSGHRIEIRGFGSFSINRRAPRLPKGFNHFVTSIVAQGVSGRKP
jgi:integration host factor subunit beta